MQLNWQYVMSVPQAICKLTNVIQNHLKDEGELFLQAN